MRCLLATILILFSASITFGQTCQNCQPQNPVIVQPQIVQPNYAVVRTPGLLTPIGRLLFGTRMVVPVQPSMPPLYQYVPPTRNRVEVVTPGTWIRIR